MYHSSTETACLHMDVKGKVLFLIIDPVFRGGIPVLDVETLSSRKGAFPIGREISNPCGDVDRTDPVCVH